MTLCSLYHCLQYKKFYFQAQHPYVYSARSVTRIMEYNGFKTLAIIAYQRYGIENHLNCLVNGCPGGNVTYRTMFNKTNEVYILELECSRKTDSVIWIGRKEG